jgi:hypothetical protein
MEAKKLIQQQNEMAIKMKAVETLMSWQRTCAYTEEEMIKLQKMFQRTYKYHIHLLNKSCLVIQHSYFRRKAGITKIMTRANRQILINSGKMEFNLNL